MERAERARGRAGSTSSRAARFRLLPFLGPAFIASVAYIDPGNFATNIAGGSQFGYTLVWVVVASSIMAILVQGLSAKLGVATGRNLAEVCRDELPRHVTIGLWLQAELIAMATDLAEFLGAAIGLHLLFGMALLPAAFVTAIASFAHPRPAAVRLPAARGDDRRDRARDRRLLRDRAVLRAAGLSARPRSTRSSPASPAAARRSCSRSGSSARR